MRQPKPTGTAFPSTPPAPWMKAVFIAEVALFALAALLLWDQWECAQGELAVQSRLLKSKTSATEALRREQENTREFLNKCNNDPEFLRRVARQRLGYTEPGEVIFRLDPPPKPATPPKDSSGK